jgi:hypothetical protein
MSLRHTGLAQDYMRVIRLGQDILCTLSHILRRPSLVTLSRFLEISKAQIMKNLQNAMRNMAAIMIDAVQASRLVRLARGLVFLASGLVVAGAAMSADSGLSRAQYREAVTDANARYQAGLLRCDTTSRDERTRCRPKRAQRARRRLSLRAELSRHVGPPERPRDFPNRTPPAHADRYTQGCPSARRCSIPAGS